MNRKFDWGVFENYIGKPVLQYEFFEKRIYHLHFEVEQDDIVVDVGASVGLFPYTVLDKKPKHIYCIEPASEEFPTLVRNTCGYPVTPIHKGITNQDGIIDQPLNDFFNNGSPFFESMKFSTFRKLYDIQKIDFLKTDSEGGEYDIFNEENIDFILNNVGIIVGEWHLSTPDEKEKFRHFRDHYLPMFDTYYVYSVDGASIKWDLWNEHFIEYYNQVMIHIDNRKK